MNQYGYFGKEPASYHVTRRNLPTAWDFLYKNPRLLLAVDQNGPVKVQTDPPVGIQLFRREAQQLCSSWLVWLASPDFRQGAFTNFYKPFTGAQDPAVEPEKYEVKYTPYRAVYTLEHQNIRAITSFTLHPSNPDIIMNFNIENLNGKTVKLDIFPVLRLYANPAQLAP